MVNIGEELSQRGHGALTSKVKGQNIRVTEKAKGTALEKKRQGRSGADIIVPFLGRRH